MYKEPESFENLYKIWVMRRTKGLMNVLEDKKTQKQFLKNPSLIMEYFSEIFEDCENLIEWRQATNEK
jgi:hypothetical protein